MIVGLVRTTSNHMFGSGDFWDKLPSWFLKILKWPLFTQAISKFLKMHSGNLSQIAHPNMCLLVLTVPHLYLPWNTKKRTLNQLKLLTHFWPMIPFYNPWKHQKTFLYPLKTSESHRNPEMGWFKLKIDKRESRFANRISVTK